MNLLLGNSEFVQHDYQKAAAVREVQPKLVDVERKVIFISIKL